MPSKKKPTKVYNKADIEKKVKSLHTLYDLNNPEDLFTLVPQEMEVAEVQGLAYGYNGALKQQAVINVIMAIANKNSIEINRKTLAVFINTIISASKGKYALNKEQT